MEWKKLLLAAGGAAGVAAVLYCLLKEEPQSTSLLQEPDEKKKDRGVSLDEITKEQVQQILQEIIKSQEQMKGYMKKLTQELLDNSLDFEQTYKRVKEVQPEDPLEKHGLSMTDFDQLLEKHQNDPSVREAIAKIMGAPSPSSAPSDKVQSITVDKIKEVHLFMLRQLEKLNDQFQALPNRKDYDMKTVTIAAQAIMGSKIEQTYKITSEDIESAVLLHHTELANDMEFSQTNINITTTMAKLMGTRMG